MCILVVFFRALGGDMKRNAVILLLITTLFAPAANAVTKPDKQFDAFFAKFKTALAKKDKNAVADMTKLPFLYDSKQLDKNQFIAKFDQIVPASARACLQKEKPLVDNSVTEVFCGEAIYCFEKVKGEYKFTEIGVND
jgi:hypothetical protein